MYNIASFYLHNLPKITQLIKKNHVAKYEICLSGNFCCIKGNGLLKKVYRPVHNLQFQAKKNLVIIRP